MFVDGFVEVGGFVVGAKEKVTGAFVIVIGGLVGIANEVVIRFVENKVAGELLGTLVEVKVYVTRAFVFVIGVLVERIFESFEGFVVINP